MRAVRAALDALPIGLVFAECLRGAPATVVGHNAAYARIVGARPDASTPYDDLPYKIYRPDRMTRVPPQEWPSSRAARTGESVHEQELHLLRSNGEWRVLAVSSSPLPRAPGEEASRAVGVVLDVTDRLRAEDDLSRRGQILRQVIDTSPDPVFAKDRKSRMLFANPATLVAIGKLANQVMGRRDREFYSDPSVGEAIEANDRRVIESGVEERVEEVVPGPDGPRVFLSTKTPWRDSTGQVIGLVGISRDITERKRAEEALRRSERRFRTLIEKSSDMLLLVDCQGRFRHWSPAAVEALGWSEAEVEGTEAIGLVHPDDRSAVTRAFAGISGHPGAPIRHRARMRHKDGTWRLVEGVGRDLLADPDVGAVVLNVRDVTEQQITEGQLLQSQKLESIGRMDGGKAHDFNNLLTVMLGSVEPEGEPLEPSAPAVHAPAPSRAPSGTETVLLVEDDAGVREVAERALRAGGYQVISAAGAELALQLANAAGSPPALLVTDVIMPTMTGPELAGRLRAECPSMRVLYLSGYTHEVIGPHGVLEPGVSFLAKPFTPRSLLAKVREVIDVG